MLQAQYNLARLIWALRVTSLYQGFEFQTNNLETNFQTTHLWVRVGKYPSQAPLESKSVVPPTIVLGWNYQ